jgi:hypothetical protein
MGPCVGNVADMAWVWWLAAPLVLPVLVALVMWWRGRPRRLATMPETVEGHQRYLLALGEATRSVERAQPRDPLSGDG